MASLTPAQKSRYAQMMTLGIDTPTATWYATRGDARFNNMHAPRGLSAAQLGKLPGWAAPFSPQVQAEKQRYNRALSLSERQIVQSHSPQYGQDEKGYAALDRALAPRPAASPAPKPRPRPVLAAPPPRDIEETLTGGGLGGGPSHTPSQTSGGAARSFSPSGGGGYVPPAQVKHQYQPETLFGSGLGSGRGGEYSESGRLISGGGLIANAQGGGGGGGVVLPAKPAPASKMYASAANQAGLGRDVSFGR